MSGEESRFCQSSLAIQVVREARHDGHGLPAAQLGMAISATPRPINHEVEVTTLPGAQTMSEEWLKLDLAHRMQAAEWDKKMARERLERSCRTAKATVCGCMASARMSVALLHPSAETSAKAFGDALLWQYNAVLASAGLPLMEIER